MNRAFLLFATLVVCSAVSCRRSPAYYLDKGNKLFTKQQYADAAINYRKALQGNPQFGDAYYQLALADLRLNKTRDAYQALSRAVELLPARDDVKVTLADLSITAYLADSQRPKVLYDQVAHLSDQLIGKDPKSYDGLRLKAYLSVSDRRFEEAEKYFQMANQVKPLQPELIVSWTDVLFEDNRAEKGEALAWQLIEKDKSYGPIYDELFRRYMLLKRVADAENILTTKLKNNPTDAKSAIQLATFYARASRDPEMKSILKKMEDNPAAYPQAHILAGDFYAGMQLWEDAIQEYEQGAQANPGEKTTYLKRITNVWLTQGKGERAMQAVNAIRKQQPSDEAAMGVEASLLLADGKPEHVAKAVAQFQALVDKSPDNAVWRFNLGRALAAKGDADGARREYQEAIKKRNDFIPARLALAQQSQAGGDYQTALRYQNEILALRPDLPTIRLERAVNLINVGRDGEARRELTSLEKIFPNEVVLQSAVLDLKEKHFKQAEERFKKLLSHNRDDARVTSGLARTYAAQNQLDKAVALLREELKKSPNSDGARSLLAEISFQSGSYNQAIEEYRRLLETRPQSAQLHLQIGAAFQSKGDLMNAITNFEKACALTPKDPIPLGLLGEALSASGRKEEALTSFRRAVALKPDSAAALNDLAFQIVESGGNLDEALELAQKALRIAPEQPGAADTLGWIYVRKNLTDSAIQVFRGLIAKHPDNSEIRYHFGMALLQKGDTAEAKVQFEDALSALPPAELRRKIEEALAEPKFR